MTTLRKWRFPILIGSGLIAAGALVYFSNGHISTEKTQGAIGQRDVYRDGQVNSADVATPGTSPVASEAIFQSSEFKSLAKNPAFQEVMRSSLFNEHGTRKAMAELMGSEDFRAAVQNKHFAELVNSASFQAALKSHLDLSVAVKSEAMYKTMDSRAMQNLLRLDTFRAIALDKSFNTLLNASYFQNLMRSEEFGRLASNRLFQNAIESRSMERAMSASMLNRALSESSKK